MSRQSVRDSVLVLAIVGLGVALVIWQPWQGLLADRTLRPPVELTSIGAEVLFLDASAIVERGSPRLVVVRFNRPVELVPHHFRNAAPPGPLPTDAWAALLRAPVVFNAGQFDENLQHLGWLKAHGQWLSKARKTGWLGLLVTGPTRGGAWGHVIDLENIAPTVADGYDHVVQSMMLVDKQERVRVRDSNLSACRTIVAEDTQGRLLVMVTEGAVTLAALARWLPQTHLRLVRALNLDGGIESQLVINTAELQLQLFGQYGTASNLLQQSAGSVTQSLLRYPLPAVVAAYPTPAVLRHSSFAAPPWDPRAAALNKINHEKNGKH